jgi:hypothetical protein
MAIDNALALGIKPANFDIATPLKAAADINLQRAQSENVHAETSRRLMDMQAEDVSRGAKSLLDLPEGSPERMAAGRKLLDEYKDKGYMNNLEYLSATKHPLDNASLTRIVTRNIPVSTSAEISGEAAQRSAAGTEAGRLPYRTETVGPETSVVRPGQLPGSPPVTGTNIGGYGPPPGAINPRTVNGQPQNLTGPTIPPGGTNAAGAPTVAGKYGERAPSSGPPTTAPAAVPPPAQPAGKNAFYDEVPRMTPSASANPPGVAYKGKSPTEIKMEADAAEVYDKEIRQPGIASQQQRAGLGTLRSTLESGWETSRVGPIKEHIAGWMYAAGLSPDIIQDITGMNPTKAEIGNKETVQDSMRFVKDTIGARESLMAINAVRSAFPNNMNTKEANLALVDSMDQTAKWKQDRSNYAAQFLKKNSDIPKDQALDHFNQWWNESHPLESYISKVVPWQIPVANGVPNRGAMQKSVTYETPDKKKYTWDGSVFQPVK